MANRRLISTDRKEKLGIMFRIVGLTCLAFLLVFVGIVACKKAEEISEQENIAPEKEEIIEFEGSVKVAFGKCVFIPEARGFDIIVQGNLESGDISTLIGKEVKGEGTFSPERPSILVADKIDVKDENGEWMNVFTRSEEVVLEDYIGLKERGDFVPLENLAYDKKNTWEEKGKCKIYGKLDKIEDTNRIVVRDDKGKEVGKIIIDNFSDFGIYYVDKLRLFDEFWFYLDIKETVDWKVRRRTREMFHADVLFAGLF